MRKTIQIGSVLTFYNDTFRMTVNPHDYWANFESVGGVLTFVFI